MEEENSRRWILGTLASAQQDGARELVMSPGADGGTAVRYKTDGIWYDLIPAGIPWPVLVSELMGLAGARDAAFPKEAMINASHSDLRLRWTVRIVSPAADCVLQNLGSELV
jgi:hypothetical protein